MISYFSDTQLALRYSISRATVWRWAANGLLPQPVALSPGCTRWVASEIEARDARALAGRNADANAAA